MFSLASEPSFLQYTPCETRVFLFVVPHSYERAALAYSTNMMRYVTASGATIESCRVLLTIGGTQDDALRFIPLLTK